MTELGCSWLVGVVVESVSDKAEVDGKFDDEGGEVDVVVVVVDEDCCDVCGPCCCCCCCCC